MAAPGGRPPASAPYAAVPEVGAGGGYVSGHLAALARTGGLAPVTPPASGPPPWAPPQRPAAIDFHELLPREREFTLTRAREAPEASDSREAPEGGAGVGAERRTVAPGSHGRARAGVERGLRRLGIGEELAGELIDGALAHTLPLAPRAGLAQAVRATLAQRIPVAPPLPRTGGAIVIVGGGGAGKTTCCATLLDAYRRASSVPARYASIVRGPDGKELQLILSPQIVKPAAVGSARALRAIRAARTEGLAIIDTPRLSPSDRGEIRDLAKLLGQLAPERIVVALPATLGAAAAAQLLGALAPLRANAMVITHTDETDQLGVSIEAACAFGLAPEYTLERGRPGWRLRRVEPSELASRLLP